MLLLCLTVGANRYFREDAGVVEVLQALLIPDDGTDTDGILRCMLALERLVESDRKFPLRVASMFGT